jgi:cadmium resistance protein CadD (predicted permease)
MVRVLKQNLDTNQTNVPLFVNSIESVTVVVIVIFVVVVVVVVVVSSEVATVVVARCLQKKK